MSNVGKSLSILFILLLVISSIIMAKPAFAQTTPVATASSPINTPPAGALIVPDEYQTIQAAIDNASAGDTIFVKPGTYYGNISYYGITIDKPITLIGQNSQNTIIEGTNYRYADSVIEITANNVTISGFTITSDYVTSTMISIGEYEQPQSDVKIIGNNIVGGPYGISMWEGENYIISQNNITKSGTGISMSASNSVISDNTITGNSVYGLQVSNCQNVTIKENNISDNGILNPTLTMNDVGGFSFWLDTNTIYLYGNNITDNMGFGVQFGWICNDSAVYNNDIMGNGYGVELSNFVLQGSASSVGTGNEIYNNNFVENAQSALVEQAFPYNLTTENQTYGYVGSILGNGTDIVSWDSGKVGNYWSDYQAKYPNATEIDNSGIGNTPYLIDQNNTDYYPLMEQVNISAILSSPTPIPEFPTFIILPLFAIVLLLSTVIIRKRTSQK